MSARPPLLKGFSIGRMVEARRLNNWSQADLAEAVGMKQATIAQWERGRSLPGVPTQIRLMATLFGDTDGTLWALPERLDKIEARLAKLER